VNCIAVNDVDGYFVTGSADGDIKVTSYRVTQHNMIHVAQHVMQ